MQPLSFSSSMYKMSSGWQLLGKTFSSSLIVVLTLYFTPLQPAWSAEGAGKTANKKASPPHHFRNKTYTKRRWGIEVMFVRQSAAGYMLEFRYKVLDPKKAKLLTVRKTKPMLTHVESGAKLVVPSPETTGPMRNTYDQVAGKVYWMLFANPSKLVKPGDHVDIAIGEFLVQGIVVK